MIEVKRKDKETTGTFIRRFTRKVQESGNLSKARSTRFNSRPLSDLKKKRAAIKRVQRQKKMNYLKKLGKIEPKKI